LLDALEHILSLARCTQAHVDPSAVGVGVGVGIKYNGVGCRLSATDLIETKSMEQLIVINIAG